MPIAYSCYLTSYYKCFLNVDVYFSGVKNGPESTTLLMDYLHRNLKYVGSLAKSGFEGVVKIWFTIKKLERFLTFRFWNEIQQD
jgi:hypothetical protein